MQVETTANNDGAEAQAAHGRQPDFHVLRLPRGCLHPRYWSTWVLLGLLRACAVLPLRIARAIGAALGGLFYIVNRKRRRIARLNLRLCFPELDRQQRAHLLRKHFLATGRSYADLGLLAWGPLARIERKVRIIGLEHVRTQIALGRNVIFLAPHCVGINFGGIIAKHYSQFSMFKPTRDAVLSWFLNKARKRFGCQLLARKQGMLPVVRALTQGMGFYYIPDEDFGPGRSVFVPFFGVQTATLAALGRLAALTQAAVLPLFVRLLPRGEGYELRVMPRLEGFPNGDQLKDATRMNEVLEQGIRAMPEQYMWTFKLFKTRPGNAPSPYS